MVTRIIAGFAGSLALSVPRTGTRPTSDRVREAIFSSLDARDALRGARVLDLYAGSGALGLEAASRGASSVVLVERASAAARICADNAARILRNAPSDARPNITVASQAVRGYLEASTSTWDLVFVDPPYDIADDELSGVLEVLAPRLASDATVVLERSSTRAAPRLPEGMLLERSRSYGDTKLWWVSGTGAVNSTGTVTESSP